MKHREVFATASLTVLLLAPAHTTVAQQIDAVDAGRQQFEDKCAVCHGISGTGDGVLAQDMTPKPADLTQISKRYNGTFPTSEVFAKIWGRDDEIISTHAMSEMPAFYVAPFLGQDEEFENSAGRLSPAQIRNIISFLVTMQEQ
jgi:mono/diheme cytochrome c family protein